jgi:hypothetical protein
MYLNFFLVLWFTIFHFALILFEGGYKGSLLEVREEKYKREHGGAQVAAGSHF